MQHYLMTKLWLRIFEKKESSTFFFIKKKKKKKKKKIESNDASSVRTHTYIFIYGYLQ